MDTKLPNNLPEYSSNKLFSQDQVNLINKLFTDITTDLNLDNVLQKSADQIVTSLNLLGSLIYLRAEGEEYIYTKTISQSNQSKIALKLLNLNQMKDSLKVPISRTDNLVVDSIINNRINTSSSLKRFTLGVISEKVTDFIQKATSTGDAISIPLVFQNKVIGAIMFTKKESNVGFEDVLPLLLLYSSQVAIAINISQLFQKTLDENIELRDKLQKKNLTEQQIDVTNVVRADKPELNLNLDAGRKIIESVDEAKLLLEKSISNPFSQASGLNAEQVTEINSTVGKIQKNLYELFGFKMPDSTSIVTVNYVNEGLASIIKEVYDKTSLAAKEKGIDVVLNYPDELKDETIKANRIEFIVALNIVTDNAIQYSTKGPITISVSKNPRFVEINIKDHGVGVPVEEQSKLFKPHYEITSGKELNPEGKRLGLYTAKQVFDKHNAGIVFDSKPGEGTSVFVLIPVTQK